MEGRSHDCGNEPIVVAPLGDIQWDGHPERVALRHLHDHIDRCVALNARFLGLGDYIDFASPSNRSALKRAALYDSADDVIDTAARSLVREVADDVLPDTKGRWLGLLTGHHYYDYGDGTTSDTELAARLDTEHLGDCAYIRLRFEDGKHSGSVVIWAHHGNGNGRSATYPLRRLEEVRQGFDADVYIMGHATKRGMLPTNRVFPTFYGASFRLRHREQLLVASGGWLRAYREGNTIKGVRAGDYVEKAMITPVSLGAPLVYITPRWVNGSFEPELRGEA